MKSIKKIMVPFNFSEAAINALEYTLNLTANEGHIDILALQVTVHPSSSSKEAEDQSEFEKILLNFERRLKSKPRLLSVSGDLLDTLMQVQIDQNIDLVIMGTMGDSEAVEAITNTSKLVKEINSTVLVVPYGCEVKIPKEIALLVGNENMEQRDLLKLLLEFAQTYNSKVHVLTVYKESILAEYGADNQMENTLEYYLEHFYADHHFKKEDDLEEGIMSYIREKDIDMISVMPRNHLIRSAPSEGRLTRLLTLHADIPILILD